MYRSISILILVMLALAPSPAAAQDETPEPGTTAATQLPAAAEFGEGWTSSDPVSPDLVAEYYFEMSPDVFKEGAAATYLGPVGTRVLVVNLILTDNRTAIRKSWEDASSLVDSLTSGVTENYQFTENLESVPPPDGCVEAKRVDGVLRGYLTPVGVTMCAVDPDIIIVVAVDGTFNDTTGINASDAVIALILGA